MRYLSGSSGENIAIKAEKRRKKGSEFVNNLLIIQKYIEDIKIVWYNLMACAGGALRKNKKYTHIGTDRSGVADPAMEAHGADVVEKPEREDMKKCQ